MTKLQSLISNLKSNQVIIRMHNFSDPDAIASAYGLQVLLKRLGNIDSIICYKGKIDKFSTNEMIEQLEIEIVDIEECPEIFKGREVILVDSQVGNGNIDDDIDESEIICIDHHPIFKELNYKYSDIRPNVGSCASIIAEYYRENQAVFSKKVATALLYGIKIDTANLTRGVCDLDLDMFYILYRKSDLNILNSLESSTLRLDDLPAYLNALNSIEVSGALSFANTGNNCPEALIAMVSDFILMIDEVKFLVVYSIRTDGIKISARSKYSRYDAGKIVNIALKGLGSGGGHHNMAGGFVSFSKIDIPLESLIMQIKDNFIKAVTMS